MATILHCIAVRESKLVCAAALVHRSWVQIFHMIRDPPTLVIPATAAYGREWKSMQAQESLQVQPYITMDTKIND